jgi:hypothetical protein
MQNRAFELRRIPLPRTPVNRGQGTGKMALPLTYSAMAVGQVLVVVSPSLSSTRMPSLTTCSQPPSWLRLIGLEPLFFQKSI